MVECRSADTTPITTTLVTTQSTSHSAIINFETMDVDECNDADFTASTGHSALIVDVTQSTGHSATTTVTGTMESTGHSATIDDHQGIDPMDDLVASIKSFEISRQFKAYIPPTWPKKQDMYVGMNTSPERYLENLWLLGKAWVRKVRHVARLTLNSPNGPIWPTEVEPMALALFDFLKGQRLPYRYWANIPDRADFADQLDFVWRDNPPWLPSRHHELFPPLWEHLTGMARTWSWNWHNEARKHGAPEAVWRPDDYNPRSRFYTNKTSAARHHHILAQQRVPTIAQHIRTNKFYQVGDDETSCERPQSSPRCRDKCHHSEDAHTLKKLKKKHGLIRAPGVEPENEYGGIE